MYIKLFVLFLAITLLVVRCFGPWAKQFQINFKGSLIHVCIYGKVGDFIPTLLLQVE